MFEEDKPTSEMKIWQAVTPSGELVWEGSLSWVNKPNTWMPNFPDSVWEDYSTETGY